MVQLNIYQYSITLLGIIFTTAITFFLKDWLTALSDYLKFKNKINNIAGKNAKILYEENLYKINEINKNGLTISNDLHTIFIPIKKMLTIEIRIPCDDYEKKIEKKYAQNNHSSDDLKAIKNSVKPFVNTVIDTFGEVTDEIKKEQEQKIRESKNFLEKNNFSVKKKQ